MRMGQSLLEISRTTGSNTSEGIFGRARFTRSRTRWLASVMSVSGRKET